MTKAPLTREPSRRDQTSTSLAAARDGRQRTWALTVVGDPGELGARTPKTAHAAEWTSKDEQTVHRKLTDMGFAVDTVGITVPDLIAADGSTWIAHPDLVVGNVAVEVDSPAVHMGGPSHDLEGWPAEDTYRDDCLRAAGFQVVRIRLGGLPPVPGSHNVLRDGALTNEVCTLAAKAIKVAARGKPPGTHVASPPTKRPPTSRLGALRPDRYNPELYTWFTWRTGNDDTVVRYELRSKGRFLYCGKTYVATVDLDLVPRDQWRAALLALLPQLPSGQASPGESGRHEWQGEHELPFDGDLVIASTGVESVRWTSQQKDPSLVIQMWVNEPRLSGGYTLTQDGNTLTLHPHGDDGDVASICLNEAVFRLGYVIAEFTAIRAGALIIFVLEPREQKRDAAA